jgi:hypothetical protein
MRNFIFFIASLACSLSLFGQTNLTQGDIVFIGYNAIGSNTGAPNFISMLVRKPIESGTTIFLTNQTWNSTNSNFNAPVSNGKQGTIQLVFNEPASIGQIIEVIFSTVSSSLRSTVGSVSYSAGTRFDFDPASDYDQIYVYQYNSGYTFLSGMAWDNSAPSSGIPPNMVFSGASQNAFFNGTNGNNLKCGVWTPTTTTTSIAFNASLSSSFYDNAKWNFVTSNTISSGYCPCNPDSTHPNITNLYSIIESNIAFDKYLYNKAGIWKQWNGSSWAALASGPDWGTNTRTKEVTIHKSLSIGNSSTPYSSTTFECAKLIVEDTATGDDGVTLTIEPGNALKIHYSLSFIDNGTLKPSIYLKSAHSNGQSYYATLDPTSANLNDADGDFKYNLHIQYPGWHHFQSPISTAFNSISSSSTFQFRSGAVGTGNTFSWDPSTSQWVPISLTDNFSSQPYTILFDLTEVPCVLTVTGSLANPDQDAVANLSANYHNPSSNGNVPGWTSDGDDGWNFYGNPYLSALSTEDLLAIFSTNGNGSSNLMNGLDNKVFVWQPNSSVTNLTSDYRVKSYLSGTHGGDATATYLSPFQAFFMRRGSSNSSTTGFVKSKKYRKTTVLTSANSIVNKTASTLPQYSLTLEKASTGQFSTVYAVPHGKNRFTDFNSDVLSTWNLSTTFGLVYDSSLFSIKFWPIDSQDSSSIDVLISHNVDNEVLTLSCADPKTQIFDRSTNTIHDFKFGSYTFNHSASFNFSPRFKWIFNPTSSLSASEESSESTVAINVSNGSVEFTYDRDIQVSIIDMNGRKLNGGFFKNGTFRWNASHHPSGTYIISSSDFATKFILP